jgi:hypothetical protein
LTGFGNGLLGNTEYVLATLEIALRLGKNFLVLGTCGYTAFNAWHGRSSLNVGQQRAQTRDVGFMHHFRVAQVALTLGALLGEDVVFERLRVLVTAGGSFLEALRGATIGFQLRHFI